MASELLRKAVQTLPLVTAAAEGVVRIDRESAETIELSTGGRVISLPASAATDDLTRAVAILERLVSQGRTELEGKLQFARRLLAHLQNNEPAE